MKVSLEEIKEKLRESKKDIEKKYKVKIEEIGIFGSYIKKKAKEDSDIDILIKFDREAKISLLDFMKIEMFLTQLLGKKVDLVEKESLKYWIGKKVLGEVIYV